MKSPDSTFKQEPSTHSISIEEFKKHPEKLEPYKPLDKVTRENFVSFFIESFRISQGKPEVQALFIRWLRIVSNFNYELTFHNFIQAGRSNIFSKTELLILKDEFGKINKHHRFSQEPEWSNVINREIDRMVDFVELEYKGDTKNLDEKLSNMKSSAEFSIFAREEVKRLRAEYNEKYKKL